MSASPPPPPAGSQAEEKARFRTQWRGRRRDLGEAERAEQSADLTRAFLDWYLPRARHRRVAVVMSYGAEPDTGALLARLHGHGVEALVPVTLPERGLAWVRWHPGVPTRDSAVAPIPEPVGERQGAEIMSEVDVVLVPALVTDPEGFRMGQGGGYYDRFLAGLREHGHRPLCLALVYRHEVVQAGVIPREALDERVDGVLTADGVRVGDRGQGRAAGR